MREPQHGPLPGLRRITFVEPNNSDSGQIPCGSTQLSMLNWIRGVVGSSWALGSEAPEVGENTDTLGS